MPDWEGGLLRRARGKVPIGVALGLLSLRTAPSLGTESQAAPDAAAESEPSDTLGAELDWARSQWPESFRDAQLSSSGELQALMSWVPRGQTIKAALFTAELHCSPVELYRCDERVPRDCGGIGGRIVGRPFTLEGQRRRKVRRFSFHTILTEHDEGCGTEECTDRDGGWRRCDSGCVSLWHQRRKLVLSQVTETRAVYGGERAHIVSECRGPREWLPCDTGGDRYCDLCQHVSVHLVADGIGYGSSPREPTAQEIAAHPNRCTLACPEGDNATLTRIHALKERLAEASCHQTVLWQPSHTAPDLTPTLYKSPADCLKAHPKQLQPR